MQMSPLAPEHAGDDTGDFFRSIHGVFLQTSVLGMPAKVQGMVGAQDAEMGNIKWRLYIRQHRNQ